MTRPLKPATDRRQINHAVGRVRDLERRVPAGDWIYVGDFPSDPGTTDDSPPHRLIPTYSSIDKYIN